MVEAKRVNDSTFWTTMREVFAHDAETLDLNRFKIWASTIIVPLLSIGHIKESFDAIANMIPQDTRYHEALQEPFVGCNYMDFNNHFRIFMDNNYSSNRIRLLSHLISCGWDIEALSKINSIVEIGAGIGEMTDVIHQLGFEGKYYILDFPEIHTIQKFLHDTLEIPDVEYVTDLDNFPVADLGIACFSFTEMPIAEREKIINNMALTKNWLIIYSGYIFGIDNDAYIKNVFVKKFTNHDIEFIDVPYMNWDGGTKYLSIKQKVA
jgi:hypothetical protein